MRFYKIIFYSILSSTLLFHGLRADDKKEDEKPAAKKKEKKERPELEDAVKRGYHKGRLLEDQKITRFQVTRAQDDDENEAVLCIVEFATGDVGFYLGSRSPEKDQWILIQKADTEAPEDALHRARK